MDQLRADEARRRRVELSAEAIRLTRAVHAPNGTAPVGTMAHGPERALAPLRARDGDGRLAEHHRLHAVRAHLLEMAGDRAAARAEYVEAAARTLSLPERRYLQLRAARLG
ncbi:hypothetical protein [Streptomyces sp. NPDC012746]|uniref:hypothetical protein n=1 Tax=Streptomyces sp. NPDC012746 TaxID=3364845 RepID=UPI0036CDEE6D